VSGSLRVGIYLERESKYNTIKNSKVYNNGLGNNEDYYREGIAIDSSSHNNLVNNEIYNNKLAGITLYKNCGECPAQIIRLQQSNYNTLQNNEIYNNGIGNQSVGIWIASRQGNYYSCCADDDYGETNRYFDYARYNIIKGNNIYNQYDAIKVQDDYNYIYENIFYDNSNLDTWVGSDFKELVGDSVKGIELFKNEIRTNPEKEKLMVRYGSQVEFSNNVDSNGNCINRYPGNCGEPDVNQEPKKDVELKPKPVIDEKPNVFSRIVNWFNNLFS
jgi:parallel beta-helix repeat protein